MPSPFRPAFPDRARSRTSRGGSATRTGAGLLACSLVLVGGCKLVDQRTFNPSANRPPPPPVLPAGPPGRAPAPVPPLAAIPEGAPPESWKAALSGVARAALDRKPNVLFRVISRVPTRGGPDAQATALASAGKGTAQQVADVLTAAGAAPAQVELSGESVPGLTGPDVQVFVK
ncbi:hypothetical protein [Rhizosaccharibacter radicis]|uniref:Uncharacterized protein n=1 Tax=Rhizosaccharibacter radicis TaxID=2782605 RepID=A0ABT1VZ71_9PROT|nr:hypothetical protein [Acetobacteraceae bacterium KSS12]